MKIEKLESPQLMECDECGRETKRLYMIEGDIAGHCEGYGLTLCKTCYSNLRLKVETAMDNFKLQRKKISRQQKLHEDVDPLVSEMHHKAIDPTRLQT